MTASLKMDVSIRDAAMNAYRKGLPALTASVAGGLIAGVVFGGMRAELRTVPGLLVLVPALLATRGNVYGSLGARVSTGLHQGLIEPRFDDIDERLVRATGAALFNGLLASAFAALLVFSVLSFVGTTVAPFLTLVAIAVIAGIFSGSVLIITVITAIFFGYQRGRNPDDLVGPIVTTTGDIFGILFLLIAVRLVLAVGGIF
jgi:Permease, similar to cation transporters